MPESTRVEDDALAVSSRELRETQHRLREVLDAYAITKRSRFARAGHAIRAVRSLFGGETQGEPMPTEVPPPGTTPDSRVAPMLSTAANVPELYAEIRTLDAERLRLHDLLKAQRNHVSGDSAYDRWRNKNTPRLEDLQRMRSISSLFPYRPLISIVVATYNTPDRYLRAALDSVIGQAYEHLELCVADDASTDARVRDTLDEYAARDSRIKLIKRATNGHIAKATNSALELATGEFVGFLDHDDLLTPEALFEIALLLNHRRDSDLIYSDEDKIDDFGVLTEPHFKPDWAPDSFLSRMYTCHFTVIRRTLIEAVGGLRPGFDGSQDYDLTLRVSERTARIEHIPKVLYHWRKHAHSTAMNASSKPYTSLAAERAITEAIERRGEPGVVNERADGPGTYIVRYKIRRAGKVSIVIPTRDFGEDVDRCLTSIFAKSTYANFEIVLLDNGSTERSSLGIFDRWAKRERRVNVLRHDVPFNFSTINNFAARRTDGEYILFLNNDTEIITRDWLEAMVEQAQRPSIGAVGAQLLYPDGTIQHAGVIVGLGGVAGHSHKYFPGDSPGYFNILKAVDNYSAVTAACLMIRRDVFEEVGAFDESLAVAFNDVDLCLKIDRAGYRNVYLPHVQLYHFESKSRGHETTPDKQARFAREIQTMNDRWSTKDYVDRYYSPHLTLTYENFAIRD